MTVISPRDSQPPPRISLTLLIVLTSALMLAVADLDAVSLIPLRMRTSATTAGLVNVVFAASAMALGGVSRSGAIAGAIVGFVLLTGGGWPAWTMLAGSFVVAAGTTRFGRERKQRVGLGEERGGRRAAGNVAANTGTAALGSIGILLGLDVTMCRVAIAAALTTAASDTAASEIGKAMRGRTWQLSTLAPARPGATGGISLAGTCGGAAAAAALAAIAALTGLLPGATAAAAITVAAVIAQLVEGVVATTFETSGWIDNNGVNFVCSLTGVGLAILFLA